MLRRRIISFSMAFLVVLLAIGLFLNHMKSNVEYYHLFEDQHELFEALKDEIQQSRKSEMGYQSNFWGNMLYSTPQQFHDEVRPSLRDKIKQINHLSGSELDILSYDENDADSYHIVSSKSRDGVESFYSDRNIQYDLIKLDDDWYGTKIGDAYLFQ